MKLKDTFRNDPGNLCAKGHKFALTRCDYQSPDIIDPYTAGEWKLRRQCKDCGKKQKAFVPAEDLAEYPRSLWCWADPIEWKDE